MRIGLKKCGSCKKQFTVKVGTVFEQSHVPLNVWLQAVALITASKKGFSSNQLSRVLGVTLKTAWFMTHRIREAMTDKGVILGGGGGVIEADETFLGADAKTFVSGKAGLADSGQKKILAVVSAAAGCARNGSKACKSLKSSARWKSPTATPSSRLTKPTTTSGSARSSSAT